ncbi:MAG: bacterial Ig-like domain-containing protein [Treponema sp.]|jgi:hypothetical protein|nr:bacterial Ig-like domain-containing protein [Treponema sp.]
MESVKIVFALLLVALLLAACPMPSAPPEPEPGPNGNPEITLAAIAISRLPNKTAYAKGEDFDPAGLVVTGTYSDGSTREETGYTLSGIDMNSTGEKTVTVSLEGFTATFTITLGPAVLVSLKLSWVPDKTIYVIGEAFDPTGLEVTGTYTDKTTKLETGYTLSPVDMNSTGEKTVTVTLPLGTGTWEGSFTIRVEKTALVGITLAALPTKRTYVQGEDFDPAGLEVVGQYGDGSTRTESSYNLSRALTDTVGEKTVTVSLNTFTATFTITITEPVLLSIAITRRPNKISYAKGEAFDPTGLVVKGTYNNGKTEDETGYTLSAVDTSSTGTKTVTVSLKGFTATFTITVGEAALASIAISRLPDKTAYTKGETLDTTGLEVTGTYTDGTTKLETGYTIGAVDMNSTGEKQVRVSLKGKSTTFTITVNPALLASIAVTKPPAKGVYMRGAAFQSAAGLEVTGTYTDKTTKRETGYTVGAVDTNSAGIKPVTVSLGGYTATFFVAVVEPALYFDYGRRHSPMDPAEPGRYSVPLGRTLVLAPVRWYISDTSSYTWRVDGSVQPGQGEYFSFTPTTTGTYTVTVSAEGSSATASVVCVPAEGTYRRTKTATSKAHVTACFEFTPAPGQFVHISPGTTEESVRLGAQATVDSNTGGTNWAWSLGAWGGYIVTGFDHSVENTGGYDLAIYGNPLQDWSEPGTVWVMQDENGNNQPDDTWYELKASETGKSTTKQRYAVTYYKPDGIHEPLWVDNMDSMGSFPVKTYYDELQGYPYSVPGDWVTFVGTRLPNTLENGELITNPGFIGPYVDNEGTTFFKISDAIQVDGTSVPLAYIDFVKVQTAVNNYAGILGEVSTETSLPFDYTLLF